MTPTKISSLFFAALLTTALTTALALTLRSWGKPVAIDYTGPLGEWPVYGGEPGGSRYSPLTQITPDNVENLKVAWVYHTQGQANDTNDGDNPDAKHTSFSATPILDNNTLYFCSGLGRAFAINAETGAEIWVHDAKPPKMENAWNHVCRGVALWKDPKPQNAICSRRIFMGVLDGTMVGLDATTGKPCEDFGKHGVINLSDELGDVRTGELYMTSPPTVINDLVIPGALVTDNQRINSPGGVIRAWDVHTGQVRWAFDPVPPGAPSPQALGAPAEQKYHRGTPNAWSIFSIDQKRNLIFIPFGGAGPDFIGGHRKRFGFDLDYYANSVVALDAANGQVVWHFQVVHHDLWDYDIASQPVLIDIKKKGAQGEEIIPALAQATKIGHLFLLNRETGQPLYPVEERAVPQTSVPGEYTSPTQPFPTFPKPLHPHSITPDDAWGFTFYDRGACREKIAAADNQGIFTPPSLNHFIEYPGVAGGQNWGSLAYDPKRQLLVMPQNYVVAFNQLIPRDDQSKTKGNTKDDSHYLGYSPNEGTPYVTKHEILLSPFGVPCIAPPWGTLFAIDLASGEKLWEKPFGTTRDMVPGLSLIPFGLNFGMPSAGGPLTTETGLVFIGATMDNYIRAYHIETGEELWRGRLPAGGQATPMTYRVRKDGKQYVVIAAGGHAIMRTTLGDSLMAFALPD